MSEEYHLPRETLREQFTRIIIGDSTLDPVNVAIALTKADAILLLTIETMQEYAFELARRAKERGGGPGNIRLRHNARAVADSVGVLRKKAGIHG